MMTARAWKAFYAAERARLGEAWLLDLIARAPEVALPDGGALVVPHTRLETSGASLAAAARALVRAGVDQVLALGVLHGAREADADEVARARAGDPAARRALRRVHGPGAPGDDGRADEEFSLDALGALVALAARAAGRPAPRIVARYPFLTGDTPAELPGLDELRRLRAGGAVVVATADPIHHGVGYGTPPEASRPAEAPATEAWARAAIEAQLAALAAHRYDRFLEAAQAVRSDFRDTGPALAALLDGPRTPRLHALQLVDYADVLAAPRPTWVAAALWSLD